MLLSPAAWPNDSMAAIAYAHYFVLLGYAAIYAGVWLAPLLSAAASLKPDTSLSRLRVSLFKEKALVEAEVLRLASLPQDFPPNTSTESAAVVEQGNGMVVGDEHTDPEAADIEAIEPDVTETADDGPRQRLSTERLSALPALRDNYPSQLVQDAVDQIRVQYPVGAYQQVNLERLPSFVAYVERVGTARMMAGLFVLIGLLLTMVRLDVVVEKIGGAAQTATTQDGFLETMSAIMQEIGGAFVSSIWGLGLMLCALLVVAAVDRVVQGRFAAVERALSSEIIPTLSDIHTRLMPDLSLGDLLAETGTHLRTLNGTVDGLTEGMANSLAGLGERIGDMLQDFHTFQEQYVRLNDLLRYLKEASENLGRTTKGLEGASRRLSQPLDEFNRNLLAHLETVADAVAINRDGYALTSDQLVAIQGHIDAIMMGVKNDVSTRLTEAAVGQEATLEAVIGQSERTNQQLVRVADALDRTSNVQLESAIATLMHAAERLGRQQAEASVPPSLFAWIATLARRSRRNGLWSLFSGRG